MLLEGEIAVEESYVDGAITGWYRSSERAKHPHPRKLRVECSIDEDVVRWLKGKVKNDEEYHMYVNRYLRKLMALEQG
jgi:hypothetical protein